MVKNPKDSSFQEEIKELTMDVANHVKLEETEQQTEIPSKVLAKSEFPRIEPKRTIFSQEKFNEKFRKERDYAWEYVDCICENIEIKGESVDFFLKKFPGEPAHEWVIPVNKPVSIPRFVAEHLHTRNYAVLTLDQGEKRAVEAGVEQYGMPVYTSRRKRIDCIPHVKNNTPFSHFGI